MTWRNHTIIFSIFYRKKLHTIVSFETTSKFLSETIFTKIDLQTDRRIYNSELRFNDSYIDRRKNLITK